MKNILFIFILLSNLTFGQSVPSTAAEIEKYATSIEQLKAANKLVQISYPNMSSCGGSVLGYYLNKKLVLIDATYSAELGFSSKTMYLDQDKFLKVIYREHYAEWGEYERKYASEEQEFDPSKMTYTDTVYSITLANPAVFLKKAGDKVVSKKVSNSLVERLLKCGEQMKGELTEVIEQVDSLKHLEEMPYICHDLIELYSGNVLTSGCGDQLYWNVVGLHSNVIELLIDQLDDSTTTVAIVPLFGEYYRVADIAYDALSEIIHDIPTFELLGVPFDEEGCGYCAYWQHLNSDFANRQKFKEAVRNWYVTNKEKLVWIESNHFASCDCSGKHPNGGHFALPTQIQKN
jgi:hypothetical protein